MNSFAEYRRRLWRRLLAVSIRTKILGMVIGILVYWLGLVILRRFLAERLLGPAVEAETFVDMILLVSIVLFLPPSLLVAYLLTRAMTTPILELTRVADAVGRGDLSQRARVKSRDEIADLAAAFNRMLNELSRAIGEARQHSDARTHLLRRLISVQEEERRRVAHELHDRTSQWLTSLSVYLKVLRDTVRDEEVQQCVKQTQEVADQLLRDIHQLSWELRPSALDHLGLVPALEHCIAEWSKRPGPKIDFHVQGFDGERLADHLEITLYRIVQEAITNVMKHAGASHASVILERMPQLARAIIEDNGRGFDVDTVLNRAEPAKRLGLLGMQERAELVGGNLEIESGDRGTTVFVEIPTTAARAASVGQVSNLPVPNKELRQVGNLPHKEFLASDGESRR